MKPAAFINRMERDAQATYGVLGVDMRMLAWSLERSWDMNRPNVSCVPAGQYDLILVPSTVVTKSTKGKWTHTYEIVDVPDERTLCRLHPANYWHQLKGCMAPGKIKGTNARGERGVFQSCAAFDMFMTAMSGAPEARLTIRELF